MDNSVVVLDIDGVLAPSYLEQVEGASDAGAPSSSHILHDLEIGGIPWTIATGRSFFRAIGEIGLVRPPLPMVVENVRVVSSEGSLIRCPVFTDEELERIEAVFECLQNTWVGYVPDYDHRYRVWSLGSRGRRMWVGLSEYMLDITGSLSRFMRQSRMDRASRFALPASQESARLLVCSGLNWTRNEKEIDILPDGQSKASAVREILKMCGIAGGNVIAVVNDYNDVALARMISAENGMVVQVGDLDVLRPYAAYQLSSSFEVPVFLRGLFMK